KTKIYQLALIDGLRSPFAPATELSEKKEPAKKDEKKDDKKDADKKDVAVRINFDGLQSRLFEVPIGAGNYRELSVNDKALFYVAGSPGEGPGGLNAVAIANENIEAKTVVGGIRFYELSGDGKKLLVRKDNSLYVIDAAAAPADLGKKDVDLSHWQFS